MSTTVGGSLGAAEVGSEASEANQGCFWWPSYVKIEQPDPFVLQAFCLNSEGFFLILLAPFGLRDQL